MIDVLCVDFIVNMTTDKQNGPKFPSMQKANKLNPLFSYFGRQSDRSSQAEDESDKSLYTLNA